MKVCICACDWLSVLMSGRAAIPLRPAEVPGNAAVPPGLSDRGRGAETSAAGGALLGLHGRPCESSLAS